MKVSSTEKTTKKRKKIKKTSEGAAIAKEQGLPLGWTAERRSGGHYVVYSSSGARFTSINAARQAARAETEAPSWKRAFSPLAEQPELSTSQERQHASPAAKKGNFPLASTKRQQPGLALKEVAEENHPCLAIDQSLAAQVALLPSLGDKGIDADALYSARYAPPENDVDFNDLLSGLDTELIKIRNELSLRVKHPNILGGWRRGERLEACYCALSEAKFQPREAASILAGRAPLRRKRDLLFSEAEAKEAARLIESTKKDLPQVAARLVRPVGEVLAWYYREYKHFFRRKKAPWPSKTAYEAVKKAIANSIPSSASSTPRSQTTAADHKKTHTPKPLEATPLSTDTLASTSAPVAPRFFPGRIRTPIFYIRGKGGTKCGSSVSTKHTFTPRDWVPTERARDRRDNDDDSGDPRLLAAPGDELDNMVLTNASPVPREHIAQSRRDPSAKPFDFARYTPGGDAAATKRMNTAPRRPRRSDPALERLSGATYQGLYGALWYVTKPGDSLRTVAADRALCPRQLGFINARLVLAEGDELSVDETALDADLGSCLALLLPQIVETTALSSAPVRKLSKFAGGDIVASPSITLSTCGRRRCWYIARAGETLSAVALFLVGAIISPQPANTIASSSKKKQPAPARLGPRANVEDRDKPKLVDALFREQLAWLAYEDAKLVLSGALDDKTPLLLPDHAPWPLSPENRQPDEVAKLEVLAVAPPLLESDDANALLRGEIVVEKENKRRWAAVLASAGVPSSTATRLNPLVGQCPDTKQRLVTFGEDHQRSLLPRSLRSAARSLGVEESELRRLNAALNGLDAPDKSHFTKVTMLLLPEPLRPACSSCRISRISSWVCRSELKHTAPPCDKAPASGWQAGTRLKVKAQVSRSRLEPTPAGDDLKEVEERCNVWLNARLLSDASATDELRIQAEAPDYRDGEVLDSALSPMTLKWPSERIVALAIEKNKDIDASLVKLSKFLIGRSLDSWGDGPSLTQLTRTENISLRWRVVSVYRSDDEDLRVSGEDDVVALLEPESRALVEGHIPAFYTGSDRTSGQVSMNLSYARCAVSHLLATGSGWRPCAQCVVDGCLDAVRCRSVLRHDDPDCDALPKLGGPVRLRSGADWLCGRAVAIRPPGESWTPDIDETRLCELPADPGPSSECTALALEIEGRSLERLLPKLKEKVHASVLLPWKWPDLRRLVAAVPDSEEPSRSPSSEQRAMAGRVWRYKSDDFSKLRAAISRNDTARGEARLRLVLDLFESFAEGFDGICVRHCSVQHRCASLATQRTESTVTRLDAWNESMVPADTLGPALHWQPTLLFETATDGEEELPIILHHPVKPGEVVEVDGSRCYYVCRGGESISFIAEWTASDLAQLRHANRRLLQTRESADAVDNFTTKTKKNSAPSTASSSKGKSTTTSPVSAPAQEDTCTKSTNDEEGEVKKSKRKRRRTETTTAALKESTKRHKSLPVDGGSTSWKHDEVLCQGDIVRIAGGPLRRLVPPVDAVQGENALVSGEAIDAGNGSALWYICEENDNCDRIAKRFGLCDGYEIVAANRHRRTVRTITNRSQLSRWTALLLPRINVTAEEKKQILERERRKPCAACVISGDKNVRHCRDIHGHSDAPDFDDLSAAAVSPSSTLGSRIRVRWLDEETNAAQWLFATVIAHSSKLKVSYEDGTIDDMEWPNADAVAVPRDTPPRPVITPDHEALIGQSFEWKKSKSRWLVTDVFDSYDEGVDTLVAMIKPLDNKADEDETYETIDDLLSDATNWLSSTAISIPASSGLEAKPLPDPSKSSSKRRRSETSAQSPRKVRQASKHPSIPASHLPPSSAPAQPPYTTTTQHDDLISEEG